MSSFSQALAMACFQHLVPAAFSVSLALLSAPQRLYRHPFSSRYGQVLLTRSSLEHQLQKHGETRSCPVLGLV